MVLLCAIRLEHLGSKQENIMCSNNSRLIVVRSVCHHGGALKLLKFKTTTILSNYSSHGPCVY